MMDKQERKALVKGWKAAERDALVAAMPLTPDQLQRLLGYLDANLNGCDHTLKLTTVFLHHERLDPARVLLWLRERASFCDCEALSNLEELNEALQAPPVARPLPVRKAPRTPRPLRTGAGWELSDLPKPWRVGNLFMPKQPVELQFGRGDGCVLKIIERALPAGDQTTVSYWSRLWCARTKLPVKDPLRVTYPELALPAGFTATLVRTPSWTPVYCWIIPPGGRWHLEARTELRRWEGDLPQIAALITRLTETAALD